MSSLVATTIVGYSASTKDLDTVACSLDFEAMGDTSRVMKYPVSDHLDSG